MGNMIMNYDVLTLYVHFLDCKYWEFSDKRKHIHYSLSMQAGLHSRINAGVKVASLIELDTNNQTSNIEKKAKTPLN
jgi:hypothetical protein